MHEQVHRKGGDRINTELPIMCPADGPSTTIYHEWCARANGGRVCTNPVVPHTNWCEEHLEELRDKKGEQK